jgi:hypothetical protein
VADGPDDGPDGWVQGASGAWLRALHGLLLRVKPAPDDAPLDGLWTWEVVEAAGRGEEHGIERGGAESRDTAMTRAEAAARARAKWPRARRGW